MPINPNDAKLEIDIGRVGDEFGVLEILLQVRGNGRGELSLHAYDPKSRRDGVLIFLDLDGYNKLRKLIKKTDETIRELSEKRQMTQLMLPE